MLWLARYRIYLIVSELGPPRICHYNLSRDDYLDATGFDPWAHLSQHPAEPILKPNGCTEGQGYLFSKAVPAADIAAPLNLSPYNTAA